MTSIKKVFGFGFLTWLIPFVLAFAFYTPDGKVWIGIDLFKSIMIVIASLVGSLLLVKYFKNVRNNYFQEGVIVGLVWLAINLVLDILILLPMSKMALGQYFSQIGLRYLMIPIISTAFGMVLNQSAKAEK